MLLPATHMPRHTMMATGQAGGGTTGPASINPETDRVYGLEFPLLQVSDFVSAHREVIKSLGISKLAAAIGGSLGGMQVLDWSLSHPEELGAAVIIAASSRLTAQNIAFSAVARSAIMRDPNFQEGRFLDNGTRPDLGLAIARMMAHITYLSEPAMSEKFGRTMTDQASPGFGTDFQVESYLNHQGNTFLNRFDALSYLYLTRAMDFFDPFAGENAFERVRQNPVNYLVISFDSDWRFSTEHSLRIAAKLEHNRLPVTFREIQCSWGHDSFLLADPDYHATIRPRLSRDDNQLLQAHRPGDRQCLGRTYSNSRSWLSQVPGCSTLAAAMANCCTFWPMKETAQAKGSRSTATACCRQSRGECR